MRLDFSLAFPFRVTTMAAGNGRAHRSNDSSVGSKPMNESPDEAGTYQGAGKQGCHLLSNIGAEGRTRTDMVLPPVDFESTAYTNFATPAISSSV